MHLDALKQLSAGNEGVTVDVSVPIKQVASSNLDADDLPDPDSDDVWD
jgi:hypothetical protein